MFGCIQTNSAKLICPKVMSSLSHYFEKSIKYSMRKCRVTRLLSSSNSKCKEGCTYFIRFKKKVEAILHRKTITLGRYPTPLSPLHLLDMLGSI